MTGDRDEFTAATKQVLALRAARIAVPVVAISRYVLIRTAVEPSSPASLRTFARRLTAAPGLINFAAKVDDFATEVKNASTVQSAQQGKLVLLTWVIAIATAVYAGLNIVTAFEMSQANAIQRDMVAATNKAADAAIAANLIQRDMVTATNTAAQAAIAANEIQRQALENSKALSKHK